MTYTFINHTMGGRAVTSTAIIPGYNSTTVDNLNNLADNAIIQIFRTVIQLNNWKNTDLIAAESLTENKTVYLYEEGRFWSREPYE